MERSGYGFAPGSVNKRPSHLCNREHQRRNFSLLNDGFEKVRFAAVFKKEPLQIKILAAVREPLPDLFIFCNAFLSSGSQPQQIANLNRN
ncbi:hypothetical protein CASFOL_029225 [Castilleja foliolosa]|uniref:Uncharacterized protein n=1 Tax=Castilleja foliolosa TaxID=1961234 RepID=A0ABD3CC32_9LAMI